MAERFDVFLSYASTDRAAVERIAVLLRDRHIEPWWDRWSLTPGGSWQDEIVDGLYASRAYAVMVGPSGLGKWAREELGVALDRASQDRGFRIFMVLLAGAPELSDPSLAFLRTRTWVDLRGGIADAGLDDLVCAITGAPRRTELALADPGTCPYRGLEAFQEEHAEFFFGREDDVAVIVDKLKASRFVAVLGPSGSGKSSLVRAGLVPALRRGAMAGSEGWTSRVLTPGRRSLLTLAMQVTDLFPTAALQLTLDHMGADRRGLDLAVASALRDRPDSDRVLLVVDQFEELFTLCEDEEERSAFLANLLYAATIPGGQVVVVVGLRADFYHRCASYPDLRALVADHQFLVGPLDADGLRRAVEEPARRVGLEIEPGLVDTIMADIGDRGGTLPLLEHVLFELWKSRRGAMLTLEAYVAAGGVQGALAKRADAVYAGFSPQRQIAARRVLLRLVQPGEEAEDTRRRAPMAELVTGPQDESDVDAVVSALADQRLVTIGRDESSGARVVDIAHEALIRGWPELRAWVRDEGDHLRAQRHVTEAAGAWSQADRGDDDLYSGARLAYWDERTLDGLTEVEREFLAASRAREARQRAAGRRRTRLVVTGIVAAVTLVAAVALVGLAQVSHQRNVAATERDVARSRDLVNQAEAHATTDPQLAALLDLAAYRTNDNAETRGGLLRRVVQIEGVRRILNGHTAAVSGVTFSPDGRTLASAGGDGVMLWDVARGSRLAKLSGHTDSVSAVAFSPDGRTLASAGLDGKVILWDVVSRRQLAVLTGHTALMTSVAFSPDGRTMATGGIGSTGSDGEVIVWDVAGRGQLATFTGHIGTSVAFSPDGRTLAAGGGDSHGDSQVSLWDVAGRSLSATYSPSVGSGFVFSLAFSPDGAILATGSLSSSGTIGDVKRWDVAQRRFLEGPLLGERAVSVSPDGSSLAFGNQSDLELWKTADGTEVTLRGHGDKLRSVAFSPDGHTVATGGADHHVILWDTTNPLAPGAPLGPSQLVLGVSYSRDGRTLASLERAGGVNTLRLWDMTRHIPLAVLPDADADGGVGFSPDGATLLVGQSDAHKIALWNVAGRTRVAVLTANARVHSVSFNPDGRTIAAAYDNDTIGLWDLTSRTQIATLTGNTGHVSSVTFSPDGRLLASAGSDRRVLLWDLATKVPHPLDGHTDEVTELAFSPDGRTLASGGLDKRVILWDVATRTQRGSLAQDSGIRGMVFSPDGALLATGGDLEGLVLWDVAQRIQLGRFGAGAGSPSLGDFSPDGFTLATAGFNGIFLWDIRASSWQRRLCDIVGRDLTRQERAAYLSGHTRQATCGRG